MRLDKCNEQDVLANAYMELGKAYYEGAFEDPLPQLLPLFDRITRIKNEINASKVLAKRCPRCGNIIDEGSVYCGNCGERIF